MNIDESVIDKVLDNEASATEAAEVSRWFATEEGRRYLVRRLDKEAEGAGEKESEKWVPYEIPEYRMRQRFLKRIKRNRVNRFPRWLVAAVLVPFILLGATTLFLADKAGVFSDVEYAELAVPYGEQMHVVLQDGSVVHLNSDTRLKYPKKFGMFHRKVQLWGEAYFEVAKEKNRPFLVDLEDVDVKVTGTRFNVKAYHSEPNVWVTLEEGGVLLKNMAGNEYPLHPGESAEYDRQSGNCRISRSGNVQRMLSWRTNSLNFYLTPLKEIVQVLSRQYDVHFVVSDSMLLEHRFTLSTSKVNVVDVLHDLEAVSYIDFRECGEGTFEITERR